MTTEVPIYASSNSEELHRLQANTRLPMSFIDGGTKKELGKVVSLRVEKGRFLATIEHPNPLPIDSLCIFGKGKHDVKTPDKLQ